MKKVFNLFIWSGLALFVFKSLAFAQPYLDIIDPIVQANLSQQSLEVSLQDALAVRPADTRLRATLPGDAELSFVATEVGTNRYLAYTFVEESDGTIIQLQSVHVEGDRTVGFHFILPNDTEPPEIFNIPVEATEVGAFEVIMMNTALSGMMSNENFKAAAQSQSAGGEDCCGHYNADCGYDHDDKCSWPLPASALTGEVFDFDQKTINIFVPCAGIVSTNVLECCIEHDEALYCINRNGNADLALLAANIEASSCILDKLFEEISEATDFGFWNPLTWICAVTNIAAYTEALFVTALYRAAIDIGGAVLLGNGSPHIGLGYDRDSCICGGTRRTFRHGDCNDPNKLKCRGIPEKCTQ